MKYRALGSSDVKVSEISLGCWTMGGLNWVNGTANGWAKVNEDEITAAIKRAVEAGVNHFDNADAYGNGRAELMLARVLKRLGLKSTDFVIATKMGHFPGTASHAYEPLHIRHQCEQSLQNLGRDYIDLYYLHHGDFGPKGEWLQGAADTLNALVAEGQSAYSEEHFARAVPVVKPMVLQSWANALARDFIRPGGVVPRLLAEHRMSFVAFSPLAQGCCWTSSTRPSRRPSRRATTGATAAGSRRKNSKPCNPSWRSSRRASGRPPRISRRWRSVICSASQTWRASSPVSATSAKWPAISPPLGAS